MLERIMRYISYNLGKQTATVTLDEELKNVSDYIQIYEMSYDSPIQVDMVAQGRLRGNLHRYQFSWNTSAWASAYGAHNTYTTWPGMMQDIAKIQDKTRNEMLYDMVHSLSDEDGLVLQQQINDLWDRSISTIVLSDTDEQFEQAYATFISDAERLGVDMLEEYYEANLADLRSRGL